jgi:hypothetical protein
MTSAPRRSSSTTSSCGPPARPRRRNIPSLVEKVLEKKDDGAVVIDLRAARAQAIADLSIFDELNDVQGAPRLWKLDGKTAKPWLATPESRRAANRRLRVAYRRGDVVLYVDDQAIPKTLEVVFAETGFLVLRIALDPKLVEAARAFERGDFTTVVRLARAARRDAKSDETRRAADELLARLRPDRLFVAITAGCALFFVLLLALTLGH